MAQTVRRVDDRDSSITYAPEIFIDRPTWMKFGGPQEWQSTTTCCMIRDCTATLEFEGIAVNVVGTHALRGDLVESSYSIDGGPPVFFKPSNATETRYQVQFFQSPQLQPGKHTLTVTNIKYNGWLYIDYFEVVDTPRSLDSSTPVPPSTPAPSPGPNSDPNSPAPNANPPVGNVPLSPSPHPNAANSPSLSAPPLPKSSNSDAPSSASPGSGLSSSGNPISRSGPRSASTPSNTRSINTTALIAGVLGGVVALLITAFVLRRWWKRRTAVKMTGHSDIDPVPYDGAPTSESFIVHGVPVRTTQSSNVQLHSMAMARYEGILPPSKAYPSSDQAGGHSNTYLYPYPHPHTNMNRLQLQPSPRQPPGRAVPPGTGSGSGFAGLSYLSSGTGRGPGYPTVCHQDARAIYREAADSGGDVPPPQYEHP